MRGGKNILRMQADEEDVYHLMDLRERYFVLIGAGSLIEGIAAYFLFFQIRCWNVPGKTRIIGTKNQEVWNLRKPNIEVCIVAGMIACYVIPKLLEVMKLH